MKRAWAYYRCSTDQQERSIPDQKKAMRPILQEHGIQIVETFEDAGVSGVDPVEKRPEFARMQSLVRTGMHQTQGVTSILCYDISRWGRFRDPLDSIAYAQEFKRMGLPVYFTNDKYVQFAADTRQAANAILAVLGSMEATGHSEEKSKLVTRGLTSNADSGFWTGGVTPYAMVRVLLEKDGRPDRILEDGEQKAVKDRRVILAPGPKEQVGVVQTIFDLRTHGRGYHSIAKHLNQRSIPPARGKRWSGSAVYWILKNPVYVGNLVWGRRNVSKFNEKNGGLIWRPESEWSGKSGVWESIIDRETWEKVVKSFGGRSLRYHSSNAEYPLSGIVECERCGWNFYGNTVRIKGVAYYYYTHRQDQAMVSGERLCKSYCLPRNLLDDFVIKEVKAALLDSDIERQVTGFIRRYVDATTGETGEKLRDIDRRLAEIEGKEKNVREAMEKGVDPAFAVQSLERLQQERTDLEEKRADLQNAGRILNLTSDDVANICCAVGDYLEDLEETLDAGGPERKRDVLRSIVDRVVVDRPGNLATVYIRKIPDLSGVPEFLKSVDNAPSIL